MGGITRRNFLIGAAAFGAAQLFPSLAYEGELDPKQHVFVVGDLHLTRDNPAKKGPALVSALGALVGGREGFHLIFNGDMVEFPNLAETCRNGGWQWDEFARFYISLKETGFIPHLNFGNHDGSEEFARSVLEGVIPEERIGNSSFMLGETKFILLSGMRPEELDYGFLDSELGRNREKRIVVATHFPPDKLTWIKDKAGKNPGYNLWVKKEILERIANARADILFSHAHAPFAGTYTSCGLKEMLRVVGTPSVTYTLPYLKTDFRPPQVAGITVLDVRDFMKAKFFDGKRAFNPQRLRVESRKGRFEPGPLRIGQ